MRWKSNVKKVTVEECLSLDVADVLNTLGRELLSRPKRGSQKMMWKDDRSGRSGNALIDYDSYPAIPVLHLNYRVIRWDGTSSDVVIKVELTPTVTNFNGLRYWFSCPSCERRVGKLYLPPGKRYFACRHCHDLTYTSAQTAHQPDLHERIEKLVRWVEKQ